MGESDSNYWQRLRAGRVNRRRMLSGGATVLTGGIALGLVGCGSSNNNSGAKNAATLAATQGAASATKAATAAATASSAATTAATAAGTAKPAGSPAAGAATQKQPPAAVAGLKTGGTIQSYTIGTHPVDPVANTTYRAQYSAGFYYSRLFRFNSGPDAAISLSREPIGDLVNAYEVTSDGMQYTMHLRQGVNFTAPLSRPLTSADVKASWDYFTTNPKNTNSGVYAPIVDSLTTPDANTLVFKLKAPNASFVNKLANPQYLWIMSQDGATGKIDPEQQPTGTGAWIYAGQTPSAVSWKKNPDYFVKGVPYADTAVLNIIADASTQEAQFVAGKLDTASIAATSVDSIKKSVPKATLAQWTNNSMAFMFFSNLSDPASPFKDVRLRQAVSLAVDRQAIIDAIYNGNGAVYTNIVNAGLGKWHLDPQGKDIGDNGKYFKKDVQAAKQLIAASGLGSTELKFIYPNNAYGDTFNAMADAVRGMLADAGFKLQVITVDYLKDWINNGQGYFNKGVPPNSIGYALQTPFTDPDDFLTGMFTKGGNRNHDLLDDVVTDQNLLSLVKKQAVELDPDKRLQIVYEAQRVHAGLMYLPPIRSTIQFQFNQPWVQNFWVVDDYNFGTEGWAYMSVNNK